MPDFVLPQSYPDVPELPKSFQAPPEQMHPGQIEYEAFGNNPALKAAHDALAYGFSTAGQINDLRENPNEEARAATHDRTVREAVDNFDSNWAKKFDQAKRQLQAELAHVNLSLNEAAGLTSDPAWRTAIIGTLQDMTPDGRSEAINAMIEARDHKTLACLIEAPLFVSRLTAETRNGIRDRVLRNVDPEGVRLRDQLAKALDKMEAASLASLPMRAKLRAGTEPGAWRDRAQKAAARAVSSNIQAR